MSGLLPAHVIDKIRDAGTKASERGAELGGRLRELGNVEALQHLAKKGRVNMLAKLGQLEVSSDYALARRQRCVALTRSVLADVDREFALLVKYVGLMAEHYENLSRLLDKFRFTCDGEIAISAEEDDERSTPATAAAAAPGGGGGDSFSDDSFTNLPDASSPELAEGPPSEIVDFCRKVKHLTEELQETIRNSCMNISKSTMTQLDAESARVAKEVEERQVELDTRRIEVSNLADHLAKVQTNIGNASTGVASIIVTQPEVMDSLQESVRVLRIDLERKRNMMSASEEAYRQRCRVAKKELHFLLEQTSMSTWTCYNVFFSQLSNFFEETTVAGRNVCKALIKLKNSQTIARTLTAERKARLTKERRHAEERARQSTPPVEPVAAAVAPTRPLDDLLGGGVGAATTAPNDDPFGAFLASRGVAPTSTSGGSPQVQQQQQPQWSTPLQTREASPSGTSASGSAPRHVLDDLFQ